MKKKIILILLILCNHVIAQKLENFKKINYLSVDPFENVYLCYPEKITKIQKKDGKKLDFYFSDYGQLTKIITKNPLRTTLFFKESQKIIFLDKNLSKLNKEIKIQTIHNNIISDIETHSNLVLLFSKNSSEICSYDIKKTKIIDCNKNLNIDNHNAKLFFHKGSIMIINNSEILYLNDKLIENEKLKLSTFDRLFFNNNNVYLIIKNKLYKSTIDNFNEFSFLKNLIKNDLIFIQNNFLFEIKNDFLWKENLTTLE